MKYCASCGRELPDDAAFCQGCGASQGGPVAPAPPPGAYPASGPQYGAYGPPMPGYAPPPPGGPIKNYLVQSILVTLFCCLVPGIVAIVYSSQVSAKERAGDWVGAQNASRSAMIWCWVAVGLGLFSILMYSAILVPNFIRARSQGQLTACKSNLKNIGTALEMWSCDNGGRFPTSMSQLTPQYLKQIPTCPAAGHDTYSSGFRSVQSEGTGATRIGTDAYTVCCSGREHSIIGQGAGYPQYSSEQGLISQ